MISRQFDFDWPARSPDLSPVDFWFWGHVKRITYSQPCSNLDQLKLRITEACSSVTDNLEAVIDSIESRLSYLKDINGSQID